MLDWIDPRFDVGGAALTLLILVTSVAAALRASTAKARAARDRLVATPGGRLRLYRGAIRVSAMLAVAAVAVVWTDGVDLADLGLRAPVAGDAVAAGLAIAATVPSSLVGAARFARARRDGTPALGVRGSTATLARVRFLHAQTPAERRLAVVVSVCVAASEELVYRGLFIAAGVGLLGLDAWAAALLSLAVFGVQHLYQGWRGVLGVTFIGLLFTLAYAWTGAVLAPIVVHAVFDVNALVLVPWVLQWVGRRPARTAAPAPAPAPTAVAAAPATAATAAGPADGPITLRRAVPE
ncbi:CPBP family intramembrane metalloprotease [Dactylosporangium aurantiacum]|uniref:CPBP family intramembrane metalloprotease n=1 Tax=Dactylosporangium aurantiacum TaxID=35754 RepID=A0A9Q9IK37_9ACTN|nr:CPBP family intramembrane glutamic endopeptidase [Dactylosporangium aurantiacum]MDG6109766.1 CPBP family intramembrane metalloprotease [Dactylosporangium aurantiacum]UWZ56298.1 CPBP family intramembrane metalloprotease [Dactylosporangium aurantiacum]